MNDGSGAVEALFTYGVLQTPDVQLDTFGRLLHGEDDTLSAFRLDDAEGDAQSDDEGGASGAGAHRRRVLRRTDDPRDRVFGTVVRLSPDELDAADEYLMSTARRVPVVLASGLSAWVHVGA